MEDIEQEPNIIEFKFEFEPAEADNNENEIKISLPSSQPLVVRLDKWLWAARFFRTRALAREAVENGKVSYNHKSAKPNLEIEVGAILNIKLGKFDKIVTITGLSTRRRNAGDAESLFKEHENFANRNQYRNNRDNRDNKYDGANRFGRKTNNYHSNNNQFQPESADKQRRPVRFLRRRGEQRDTAVADEPNFNKQSHNNPNDYSRSSHSNNEYSQRTKDLQSNERSQHKAAQQHPEYSE